MQDIKTVTVSLPLGFGTVNCYLVRTDRGFVLVDTGSATGRAELQRELESAGCKVGDLALIVLTHGDFDHAGNAAYLRDRYGAKIAMHGDDAGMAEQGDMFWNRSSGNKIMGLLAPLLFRFSKANRFRPDLLLQAGDDLSEHGLEARVLWIPGHSCGSVGILTAGGDLFCGDLLENTKEPAFNAIMDDPEAGAASLEMLQGLAIKTVYPGHGQPFAFDALAAELS